MYVCMCTYTCTGTTRVPVGTRYYYYVPVQLSLVLEYTKVRAGMAIVGGRR